MKIKQNVTAPRIAQKAQSPEAAPTLAEMKSELAALKKESRENDPRAFLDYKDMMIAAKAKSKIDAKITVLEEKIARVEEAAVGATTATQTPSKVRPSTGGDVDKMGGPGRFKSEKDMDIVCPVLSAFEASGRLKMNSEGEVSLSQLKDILVNDAGMSPVLAAMTASLGWGGNSLLDSLGNVFGNKMNLLELRSGIFKHPADTAILTDGEFNQERFDILVSHADEKGRMTLESFAYAIQGHVARDKNPDTRVDPGGILADFLPDSLEGALFGAPANVVEFGALLTIWGRTDPETGQRYLTKDDMLQLYRDKQLPPIDPARGRVGVADVASTMAKMGFETAFGTASGTALEGAERALGKEVTGQDSMGGAGKATCPYMNASTTATGPTSPADSELQHLAGLNQEQRAELTQSR